MIERVVLNGMVHGPSFSFDDAVLREKSSTYPSATPVDRIVEASHGVRVTLMGQTFTIPWPAVRYTQGPDEEPKKKRE
jgi:hypothetical protein